MCENHKILSAAISWLWRVFKAKLLDREIKIIQTYFHFEVKGWVTSLSKSITFIHEKVEVHERQNLSTLQYRSLWPTFIFRSKIGSHWLEFLSLMLIHPIVFKIQGKSTGSWNIGHADLHTMTYKSMSYWCLTNYLYKSFALQKSRKSLIKAS